MCIKFESEEILITGDYCSKSDSKEEDRGKVLFGRVGVFILVFVLYVIALHKVYVAMLWRLCIFSKDIDEELADIYMSYNVSNDTRPAQDPSILVLGEGSQSNPACPVILFTDLLRNFRI
ncbi:unnamed protein product [Porites evermanni]|uniref:Uncharacterized protein n=1 Tax=Porites evermanni TaxID=104178 RepID=A0ABN8LBL5_9CNID|nr:unnamed protein product [Porites evermanni]